MGSLKHIRWVGGGTGAGTTTVAGRLAERFGLPLSHSDATISPHAARLNEDTAALLKRFHRMSMDQRWLLRDPVTMYRTLPCFHGEGFDLLIADLHSLPADHPALVEGFRLLPHLVRKHLCHTQHAVRLIPTPEHRRAAFATRAGTEVFWLRTTDPPRALAHLLERDTRFTEQLAAEATRNGLATLAIDSSETLEDTVHALAERFGPLP